MQKELDFLVQSTLSPVDVREYFVLQQLTPILVSEKNQKTENQKTLLPPKTVSVLPIENDSHIEKIEKTEKQSTQIQELSHQLDIRPHEYLLWYNRARLYYQLADTRSCISDLVRCVQKIQAIPASSPDAIEHQEHIKERCLQQIGKLCSPQTSQRILDFLGNYHP